MMVDVVEKERKGDIAFGCKRSYSLRTAVSIENAVLFNQDGPFKQTLPDLESRPTYSIPI